MKVTLRKAHTHAGIDRSPGEEIEVSEVEAQWLEAHEVIETVTAKPAKSKE